MATTTLLFLSPQTYLSLDDESSPGPTSGPDPGHRGPASRPRPLTAGPGPADA